MKNHILSCAISLIETGSPLDFSVAKVAKAAGISQGNLTYHFPKKSDLLAAVVAQLIERYQSIIDFQIAPTAGGLTAKFLKFMLDNAANPTVINSFIFLWVNALKDTTTAKQLATFYEQVIKQSERPGDSSEIHANDPTQSYAQLTLAGILNGLLPIMGVAKTQFDYEGYLTFLRNLLNSLQFKQHIASSSD